MTLPDRRAEIIYKIEKGALGGVNKRKIYLVLSNDTPFLFWYRSADDTSQPIGRISLLDSSLNFDPRSQSRFEIRTLDEIMTFEATSSRSRLQWLRHMQHVRKIHRGIDTENEVSTDHTTTTYNDSKNIETKKSIVKSVSGNLSESSSSSELKDTTKESDDKLSTCSSTFYLSEQGGLNDLSLRMPDEIDSDSKGLQDSLATELIDAVMGTTPRRSSKTENQCSIDDELEATIKASDQFQTKTARSLSAVSTTYFSTPTHSKNLFGRRTPLMLPNILRVNQHRSCDGCRELMAVVNNLKDRCYELHDECGANQDLVNVLRNGLVSAKNQLDSLKVLHSKEDFGERIQYILERESKLTSVQVQCSDLRRQVEEMQMLCSEAEHARQRALSDLEAYKESIKTKEELIMKLTEPGVAEAAIDFVEDDSGPVKNSSFKIRKKNNSDSSSKDGRKSRVIETVVSDSDKMRHLVEGFEAQNQFLNQEVLDLQATIHKQESDMRELKRKNYEIEAKHLEQYSKYLLLLNHVKGSTLTSNQVAAFLHDTPSSSKDDIAEQREELTDNLGFYLGRQPSIIQSTSDGNPVPGDTLLTKASHFQNRADEFRKLGEQSRDDEYLAWLHKWDQFLVTFGDQKLMSPNNELKALVRTGVPHTYRARVWKCLTNHWVRHLTTEFGSGYYESLLKKSTKSDVHYDPLLKQIDLDLTRTLPGNAMFENVDSEKIEQLRRVLYAYRFHNSDIGYCQGLNRIAAVALLYLNESDAFWMVVAVVEKLQPCDYYSQTLMGALVDQKVLSDLVMDKLPRIYAQLKAHQVDLSLFTLSWFITCFVDVLPHKVYLHIIDAFMLEGNKVLFRFALAILKLCENVVISSTSSGAIHHCLSRVCESVTDYTRLTQFAFNELNPFPHKQIESRRSYYLNQMKKSGR